VPQRSPLFRKYSLFSFSINSQFMPNFMRFFSRISLILLLAGSSSLWAQVELPAPGPGSFATPGGAEQMDAPFFPQEATNDAPEAMWDQQFAHNLSTTAGVGNAGAVFINDEFWVSRWAQDTLFRFRADGSLIGHFLIPDGGNTLGGTRAMTTDGTDVFIANNTSTIYRIDTTTRTISGTFTAPVPTARFLTYDSLANGGNGGFWTGNFNTDITLMDLSGNALQTIPQATHTLGGMYGAAVDNFSSGGPYLWVFYQSGSSSQGEIAQLQLPQGTPTGVSRDVVADLGGTGLAGGLFVAQGIVPGEATLGGLLQGTPDNFLFGYELDFSPILYDIALTSLTSSNGLSQVPERLQEPVVFETNSFNFGSNVADTVLVTLDIEKDGTPFFSDSLTLTAVGSGASNNVIFDPFTPDGQGTYLVTAYAQLIGDTDEVPENDTLRYTLQVTESLLARDDGIHNGGNGYVVSAQSSGMAVVLHTFPVPAPLIGIDIEVENPQHGDTTYAVFVATVGGIPSMEPFFVGDPIVLDSTINEYFLPLPFLLTLPAGTYGIGVFEDTAGIFLRQSQNVFTPNVNYFSTDLSTWTASGIATARFIRPRIADCAGFVLDLTATSDNGTSNGTVTVSGTVGPASFLWDDPNNQTTAQAVGLLTGTYTVIVTDSVGCTYTDSVEVLSNVSIGASLAGIDDLQIVPNPNQGQAELHLDLWQPQPVQLRLYDLQGRSLQIWDLPPSLHHRQALDLRQLPAGVYLLQVRTPEGSVMRRLLSQ
jgi:hypothetical protein